MFLHKFPLSFTNAFIFLSRETHVLLSESLACPHILQTCKHPPASATGKLGAPQRALFLCYSPSLLPASKQRSSVCHGQDSAVLSCTPLWGWADWPEDQPPPVFPGRLSASHPLLGPHGLSRRWKSKLLRRKLRLCFIYLTRKHWDTGMRVHCSWYRIEQKLEKSDCFSDSYILICLCLEDFKIVVYLIFRNSQWLVKH